ncbi:MAG TPA: hypothetical protein VL202_12270 [Pararhizobium sp.]|uniref:hypothetical protein n=1 Tax=Pararhizobium sp. TaxID=1977563 RepID=UPI002C4F8001|nr:hypothetical protein [Pararhizobium sp.]HTO31937.1 hypothetical protein [Pararhizobium sp.]
MSQANETHPRSSRWPNAAIGIALVLARVFIGVRYLRGGKPTMFFSGLLGVIAGFLTLAGYPSTSSWGTGTFLGIDLVAHGVGWLNADRGV